MLSRGSKVVGALAPAVVMIAGCLALSPATVPAAEFSTGDVHEEFASVLDQTEELVGGVWDDRDDPQGRSCVIQFGVTGVSYPALRIGEPPADPEATVQSVLGAWYDWGYSVEQATVGVAGVRVVEVQGHRAGGELLVLRISANAATLTGESGCVPA